MTIGESEFGWMPMTTVALLVSTTAYLFWWKSRNPKKVVVSGIHVYPIKSCASMTLLEATVTDIGFSYDRFAQASDSQGNFLTPRDKTNAKLFHVKPSIVRDGSTTHLDLTCSGSSFRIDNLEEAIRTATQKNVKAMIGPKVKLNDLGDDVASWLSKATGIKDCRLTAIGKDYHRVVETNPDQGEVVPFVEGTKNYPAVSLADEAPFLLTTASSLDDLNSRLKARGKSKVDVQRFRPNIVVEGTKPWEEDTWKRIRIGGVELQVWQRCGRCTMTTIDRETLERGPEPLATLSTFREREKGQRNFGMHMIPVASTINNNTIGVGQTIEVLEYDEERLEEWKRLFSK